MNRRIRGIFLIVLGLIMSISASGIFAMYEYQADIAGENAEILLETLEEEIQKKEEIAHYNTAEQEETTTELPQITLSGYNLVGILRVPILGLNLPVLESWSYDLLQISPCRYSGSAKEGDLILLAHNYEQHFGTLKNLKIGDSMEFCDVNGEVYTYEVKESEILQKTELDRLTGSDYDLTLFTCTLGGYSRYVVRCELTAEPLPMNTDSFGIL